MALLKFNPRHSFFLAFLPFCSALLAEVREDHSCNHVESSIRHPEHSRGVLFDSSCSIVYTLPPAKGKCRLINEKVALTTSFCVSLLDALEHYRRLAQESLSEPIIDDVNDLHAVFKGVPKMNWAEFQQVFDRLSPSKEVRVELVCDVPWNELVANYREENPNIDIYFGRVPALLATVFIAGQNWTVETEVTDVDHFMIPAIVTETDACKSLLLGSTWVPAINAYFHYRVQKKRNYSVLYNPIQLFLFLEGLKSQGQDLSAIDLDKVGDSWIRIEFVVAAPEFAYSAERKKEIIREVKVHLLNKRRPLSKPKPRHLCDDYWIYDEEYSVPWIINEKLACVTFD